MTPEEQPKSLEVSTAKPVAPATQSEVFTTTEYGELNKEAPWRIIWYEVGQLQRAIRLLRKYDRKDLSAEETVIKNALIESALTHIRSILEFLYSTSQHQKFKAVNLLESNSTWLKIRDKTFGEKFKHVEFEDYRKLYDRISQDLSHIAPERYKRLPDDKNWTLDCIANASLKTLSKYQTLFERSGLEKYEDQKHLGLISDLLRQTL